MANGKYFAGGGPVKPYKKINDSIGPTNRDRIRTDDYGEPIRWKDKPEQPKQRKRLRNYVSGSTSVLSIVSLLLVIGLVATVFFAYDNNKSGYKDPVFFSPSLYLSNLSEDVSIATGNYIVRYEQMTDALFAIGTYRPYVLIDGRKYYASLWTLDGVTYDFNDTSILGADVENPDIVFTFTDGFGDGMWSYVVSVEEFRELFPGLIYGDYDTSYGLNYPVRVVFMKSGQQSQSDMPDFSLVGDAWSEVENIDGVFHALGVTGRFIVDSAQWQLSLLNNLLPWNSIATGSDVGMPVGYLDNLWKQAEQKNGGD